MGVVYESYDLQSFPGFEDGTVGYHTDDRLIFDGRTPAEGKKTTGEASNIFMKASLSSLGRNSWKLSHWEHTYTDRFNVIVSINTNFSSSPCTSVHRRFRNSKNKLTFCCKKTL